VACSATNGETTATGSGFKAANNGYIVTAAHVVRACSQNGTVVLGNETGFVPEFDPTHDLAFINSRGSNVPPQLSLANTAPSVGEPVAVLGYPGPKGDFLASPGTVVATERSVTTMQAGYTETLTGAILVRGHIEHGDSGGPAIDATGRVIGVVEIGTANDAFGYLTPVSDISNEPTPP
jgi:S1-C subfamily serine protease